jgi:hypothetical protein
MVQLHTPGLRILGSLDVSGQLCGALHALEIRF